MDEQERLREEYMLQRNEAVPEAAIEADQLASRAQEEETDRAALMWIAGELRAIRAVNELAEARALWFAAGRRGG